MADKTNRYKSPAKREAYELALALAERQDELDFHAIAGQLDPDHKREDRRQVAAKAVRVIRGRRIARRYVTLAEASVLHGVPIATLRYHAVAGSFAAAKRGKVWVAEVDDLARWVNERKEKGKMAKIVHDVPEYTLPDHEAGEWYDAWEESH
jgi:hypothetical protein